MKENSQERPGVIAFPPLIYLTSLIFGILLQEALPISLSWSVWPTVLGWFLIPLASLLALWALKVIHHAGTNVSPYRPTTVIVVGGPFQFTRNPIYLSFTLLYVGIALLTHAVWAMIFLPLALLVMRLGVIAREELYLERKFGEPYLQYKTRVRRWI